MKALPPRVLDFERPLRAVVWSEEEFAFSLHDETTSLPIEGVQVTVWRGGDETPSSLTSNARGGIDLATDVDAAIHLRAERAGYYPRTWIGLPASGIALGLAPHPEPGGQLSVGCGNDPCWTQWSIDISIAPDAMPPGVTRAVLGVQFGGQHYLREVDLSSLGAGFELHPLSRTFRDEAALVYLLSPNAVPLEGPLSHDGWIVHRWPWATTSPDGARSLAPEDVLFAGSAPAPWGGHRLLAAVLEPLPRSTQRIRWLQPEAWLERDGQTPMLLVQSAAEPDGLSLAHGLPAASEAFELSIDLWPGAIEAQPKTVVVGADRLARDYSEGPVTVAPEGLELGPLLRPRPPARFEGTTVSLGEADPRALVSTVSLYGGEGQLRDGLILVNGSAPGALDPFLSAEMAEVVRIFTTDWMLETIDAPAGSSFSSVRDHR